MGEVTKVLRFGGDGLPAGPPAMKVFYERTDMEGEIAAEDGHEVELAVVKNPAKYIYFKQASIQDGFSVGGHHEWEKNAEEIMAEAMKHSKPPAKPATPPTPDAHAPAAAAETVKVQPATEPKK